MILQVFKPQKIYKNSKISNFFLFLKTSYKIFKLLISNEANPNIYNSKGYRLVHQIVLDKDFQALKLILDICGKSKINMFISQLKTHQRPRRCYNLSVIVIITKLA